MSSHRMQLMKINDFVSINCLLFTIVLTFFALDDQYNVNIINCSNVALLFSKETFQISNNYSIFPLLDEEFDRYNLARLGLNLGTQ